MTVGHALQELTARLDGAGITTARLDCLVLMEDVLNTGRTHLLSHPELEITEVDLAKLSDLINKRAQHVPLAYLRGKTEFYGREFIVNSNVLEPRPESEAIIDILKSLPLTTTVKVLDVGSGSGALGITAALEVLKCNVTLLEVDSSAIKVTKRNAKFHNVTAQFLQNDLLSGLVEYYDVLLCNLPYVPDDFHINTAATHEPRLAIFGGIDGLELYRQMFEQLSGWHTNPRFILTESLPPQHAALRHIAELAGFEQTREDDFIQLFEPAV